MPLHPRTWIGALLALTAAAVPFASQPPAVANPPRPTFREPISDFHDKELMLTYAFGPGAIDFAPFSFWNVGVGVDQVFGAQSWMYRNTFKLVDDPERGLTIALNAAATHIRERLAGDVFTAPAWGYQGGLLVSLATDSGLVFRGGFQLHDTDWSVAGGQQVLLTPEIAYRFEMIEVTLVPGWPLSAANWNWVGLRLRL